SHALPVGTGTVCPTTLPETRVRTCDAVQCDRCFKPPAQSDAAVAGQRVLRTMVQAKADGTPDESRTPHGDALQVSAWAGDVRPGSQSRCGAGPPQAPFRHMGAASLDVDSDSRTT